ncbi:MAG: hypothetical protein RLZZ427_96 [Pseudomonadota bacterium]
MKWLLFALATFSLTSPAVAAELRFEPASSWQIDNAPQMCRLSREYAAGDEHMTLRLEQYRPGASVQVVLIGEQVKRAESFSSFEVRLGSTQPFHTSAFPLILPDGRIARLLNFQLVKPSKSSAHTWPDEVALKAINEMAFAAPVMGTLLFQTNTLPRAMIEMRKCGDSMVREWGFDPDQQAALLRQPEPASPHQKWVTFDDVKRLHLARDQVGRFDYRLDIDAAGLPTGCHVVRTFSDPVIAQKICAVLLKRGRFIPALDATGKPIASFWFNRIAIL